MPQAIVVGASGGIGAGLADQLMARGTPVARYARSAPGPARLDLTEPASIAAAAQDLADAGAQPTQIIVATGFLHENGRGPERRIDDLDAAALAQNFAVNAIGPALVARHFLPLMPRQGRIVLAFLSARVGSISDNAIGGWYGYRASKAALNMIIRNLAIEWRRKNPESIIVGLHPGTVATALSAPFRGNVRAGQLKTPAESAAHLLTVIDGLTPAQSGRLFDWRGDEIAP